MDIWTYIYDHISAGEKVILMTVIEVKGSSPGRTGFKMAVAEDGTMTGSVGGGVMEYNLVETAREMASGKEKACFIKRQVHKAGPGEERSGLICAGEQTQVFTPLAIEDAGSVRNIISCLAGGGKGMLKLSPGGLCFDAGNSSPESPQALIRGDRDWYYSERLGLSDTLYIFGAGHVSVPLSQTMAMLGFRVVVCDDREGLTTLVNNNHAHQKKIVDYHDVDSLVTEGNNSYVAIMSFGHKSDKLILSQMLGKRLKYLGMIGSSNKVKAIFDSLRADGFAEKDLACVDSPIGIPINSQTPAEIAISIAAKIIMTKNSL